MASITINFPDAQQARIRDALCEYGGFVPGGDMTRAEFARHVVRRFIRDVVRQMEREAAQRQADAQPEPDLT
jgi:hypothetical protein